MRRVALVLVVLLLGVPAYAGITVSCTKGAGTEPNEVIVGYAMSGGDTNRPRAFGLDISVSNCIGMAQIASIYSFDSNFYVAPGTFDYNENTGQVTSWGNRVVGWTPTSSSFTIEMGSLYSTEDPVHKTPPPASATLFKFKVRNTLVKTTVSIAANALRTGADSNGVIMENTEKSFPKSYVTLQGVTLESTCFAGVTGEADWVSFDKPICWCYPRQCWGDADGKKEGTVVTGYMYVTQPDLDVMAIGWLKKEPPKGTGIKALSILKGGVYLPAICADFGRNKEGTVPTGYMRVAQSDLDKLSLYWLKKEPPKGSGTPANCLPGNRNP